MNLNDAYLQRLTEVTSMAAGYPFRGKIQEVMGGGVHVIQMKDISQDGELSFAGCVETKALVKKESDWLKPDDILFAARGNRPYAFHLNLVSMTTSFFQDHQHFVAAPHFFVIRVQSESLLPAFLSWFLNQRPAQQYFARSSEGTTTKSVRREVLENVPIVIPPLEEQQKIIALNDTIRRERMCFHQLIQNGEKTLTAVADQLVNRTSFAS